MFKNLLTDPHKKTVLKTEYGQSKNTPLYRNDMNEEIIQRVIVYRVMSVSEDAGADIFLA